MKTVLKKVNRLIYLFCFALFCISINACQKELSINQSSINSPTDIPGTIKTSLLSGFVTDENNNPIFGAAVSSGVEVSPVYTFTNEYGYFEFKNVAVAKDAAVVTINKTGYFKNIKTYVPSQNKGAFFRIKLFIKNKVGTISSSSGGAITLTSGLNIDIPQNAVVNKATGLNYSGNITVTAQWIDPTVNNINEIMPGDLRGLDAQNKLKLLTSYGMAAVELTGAGGELLQIANNKQATLSFPIPSTLLTTAPSTIPLWSFDETKGLWKQEGTATKTGNFYIGNVSHFSFWNCDQPSNYVQFSCTIMDNAEHPICNALVKITEISTGSCGWGFTDNVGFVAGPVPNSANLKLEVMNNYSCVNSGAFYTQNFTTSNVAISLGTLVINNSSSLANITGTVTNCYNQPVTNGHILIQKNNYYYSYAVNAAGVFNFSTLLCGGATTNIINLITEDLTTHRQSNNTPITVNTGANAIGNFQACGVLSTFEYINYTVNAFTRSDRPYNYFLFYKDSLNKINLSSNSNGGIANFGVSMKIGSTGITEGGNLPLLSFEPYMIPEPTTIPNPIMVHITEYGNIGEYVSGNFSGTLVGVNPPYTPYAVTCNYRIKRQ